MIYVIRIIKLKIVVPVFFIGGFLFLLLSIGIIITIWFNLTDIVFCSWVVILFKAQVIEIVILLDLFSVLFVATVSLITIIVLIFSIRYIKNEKFFLRFHFLLIIFVISMILIILRPNIVRILLGWDGLGVTSYLLIIYYQSPKSANAGMLTIITNRIGDVFILIRIGLFSYIGAWNLYIRSLAWNLDRNIIVGLLVVACITKRAQIPFSAWLPAAIAAPTPVSSLVHSSTLVTAGVYLLFRFNKILISSNINIIVLFLGVMTIIIAGMAAILEIDIKKIIALSTLSQLGLIISRLGVGNYNVAFYHLITHAHFKAILFIAVGNIIHNANSYQDLRVIKISRKNLMFSLSVIFCGKLRLCGIPFFSGFYSKDLFLEISRIIMLNFIIYRLFYVSILLTLIYRLRFIHNLFFFKNKFIINTICNDVDFFSVAAIVGLLGFAIIRGYFMQNLFFYCTSSCEILSFYIKIFILIIVLLGVIMYKLILDFNKCVNNLGTKVAYGNINLWGLLRFSSFLLKNERYFLANNFKKAQDSLYLEEVHFKFTICRLKSIIYIINISSGLSFFLSVMSSVVVFIIISLIYLYNLNLIKS